MGHLARDTRLLAGALLSSDLWQRSSLVAERCRDHPFLQGIASGRLARAAFQHYVAQDAFFLDAFANAYTLCASRATVASSRDAFTELREAVDDELELHRSYAEAWRVELTSESTGATRTYTEFLLHIARTEPVGHAAAAMVPCMRLYAWLGQQLAPIVEDWSPYRDWVETYASAEFELSAARLEGLLDELPVDSEACAAHYARAMELELAFFESAYAVARP